LRAETFKSSKSKNSAKFLQKTLKVKTQASFNKKIMQIVHFDITESFNNRPKKSFRPIRKKMATIVKVLPKYSQDLLIPVNLVEYKKLNNLNQMSDQSDDSKSPPELNLKLQKPAAEKIFIQKSKIVKKFELLKPPMTTTEEAAGQQKSNKSVKFEFEKPELAVKFEYKLQDEFLKRQAKAQLEHLEFEKKTFCLDEKVDFGPVSRPEITTELRLFGGGLSSYCLSCECPPIVNETLYHRLNKFKNKKSKKLVIEKIPRRKNEVSMSDKTLTALLALYQETLVNFAPPSPPKLRKPNKLIMRPKILRNGLITENMLMMPMTMMPVDQTSTHVKMEQELDLKYLDTFQVHRHSVLHIFRKVSNFTKTFHYKIVYAYKKIEEILFSPNLWGVADKLHK
jgi:hypothetical protein